MSEFSFYSLMRRAIRQELEDFFGEFHATHPNTPGHDDEPPPQVDRAKLATLGRKKRPHVPD
jgi:hypothetical protein